MTNHGRQDDPIQGEEAIIRALVPLALGAPGAFGLEDDCALITPKPGTELVLKTDPVAEGVHFLVDDAPEDIAWKALAVNVSDLAAKAARPLGYLMALSFPEAPAARWLARFAAGLQAAQESFGCHLLGGDTDRRPGPLTIAITVIGEVETGRMVRRGTARPVEALFVSGSLGDAALGLALRKDPALAGAWGLSPVEAEHLRGRYVRPQPRLGLGPALREHASAAMDVSDGLAKDLARMCKASGCAARVRLSDVPLSPAAAKAVAADPALGERIVTGGDDYEVLAAVPAAGADAFRSMTAQAGMAVTRIGATLAGAGVVIEGRGGQPLTLDRAGWDHF
jgi:thiamine-monophosphate kinase